MVLENIFIRAAGFEPATCSTQNYCATKLRYALCFNINDNPTSRFSKPKI